MLDACATLCWKKLFRYQLLLLIEKLCGDQKCKRQRIPRHLGVKISAIQMRENRGRWKQPAQLQHPPSVLVMCLTGILPQKNKKGPGAAVEDDLVPLNEKNYRKCADRDVRIGSLASHSPAVWTGHAAGDSGFCGRGSFNNNLAESVAAFVINQSGKNVGEI